MPRATGPSSESPIQGTRGKLRWSIEHHPTRPYGRNQAELRPVLKAEDMHYTVDHQVHLAGCEKTRNSSSGWRRMRASRPSKCPRSSRPTGDTAASRRTAWDPGPTVRAASGVLGFLPAPARGCESGQFAPKLVHPDRVEGAVRSINCRSECASSSGAPPSGAAPGGGRLSGQPQVRFLAGVFDPVRRSRVTGSRSDLDALRSDRPLPPGDIPGSRRGPPAPAVRLFALLHLCYATFMASPAVPAKTHPRIRRERHRHTDESQGKAQRAATWTDGAHLLQ
jgi:hypothetical protein